MERKHNEHAEHPDYGKREKLHCEKKGQHLNFKLYPKHTFDKKSPFFRKPNEIGAFSVDKNRCFRNDRCNMKYFVPPRNSNNVQYDLTVGYKDMIRKDEGKKEYIDNILHWILLNKAKFQLQSKVEDDLNDR